VHAEFYKDARLCFHIDDHAIQALQQHYELTFKELLAAKRALSAGSGAAKLDAIDICSSWVSHYPEEEEDDALLAYGRVVGMGMNAAELKRNKRLTERVVLGASLL
jgi:phosphoheptose isomerase